MSSKRHVWHIPQYAGRTIVGGRTPENDLSWSIVPLIDKDYEIVSIEPIDPPPDMAGTGWHCYIIEQGSNTIRGYQRGNIKAVTRAVEEIVVRLNERRYGRSGRVHLTMSAQGKKAKRQ